MPAGWTIQQITHCSASLPCSDSLVVRSNAAAAGEADVATAAAIVKQIAKKVTSALVASSATLAPRQAGKVFAATVTTAASLVTQKLSIYPQAMTAATTVTTATLGTVKVTPVVPGRDAQPVGELVAAVSGGVGV